MLEKPKLKDGKVIHCLRKEYGLNIEKISFLPLGADVNTAVYRATAHDGTAYFAKLRRGACSEASVAVPDHLASLGMKQIIPPFKTLTGKLWADLDPFRVILYPFVEGRDGFDNGMSKDQWIEFGRALKQFHSMQMPAEITRGMPCEDFSPRWRESVKTFLERIEHDAFEDPVALEMADLLNKRKLEILDLIQQAEHFANILQEKSPEFIVCHADIHEWNLFIDSSGALFLVDWDTLILAPKERDLMFIGAGLGDTGYTAQEEERMFYKGYGRTEVDSIGIAYYRFARILEDIAAYCEQVFSSDDGGEDRKQAPGRVKANFLPNGTIERAYGGL